MGKAGSDSGVDHEIDASLDRLELDGPTGSSFPEGMSPIGRGETSTTSGANLSGAKTRPKPPARPKDLVFNTNVDEVTESGQGIPHTLREMRQAEASKADPIPTERPTQTTEASDDEDVDGGFRATTPGVETLDNVNTMAPSDIGSNDILDADEPIGSDLKLEDDDDEIVIADDLAEDAGDELEEHTDTGATVPPYRR